MAQLKDLIVNGPSRFIGDVYATTFTGNLAGNASSATSATNAGTIGGLSVHSGRNNEANKIVRTDANGYLQVGYINSSSGHEKNASSPTYVWGSNSSDSYLRSYQTSSLSVKYATTSGSCSGNAETATNADKLDGYHAKDLIVSDDSFIDLNSIDRPSIWRLASNNPNLPSHIFDYGNILNIKHITSDTAWQLLGSYISDALWFRRGTWYSDGTGTLRTNAWKKIAFTDSNVASSTKATQDGNGNIITSTYLPLAGGTMSNTNVVTNLNADLLDGYNASSFAKVASANNLISLGNEFNFVPSAFSGEVYINYRTTTGADGAITKYNFDNGAGGLLASISQGQFSGNAASSSKWANARTITLAGSVTGSVSIDGSANVTLNTTTNHTHNYLPLNSGTVNAICSTSASLSAKEAAAENFILSYGVSILITFTVANTYKNAMTLNVNGTGAKTLYINDKVSSASNYIIPVGTYHCYYDGSVWFLDTEGAFRVGTFKVLNLRVINGYCLLNSSTSGNAALHIGVTQPNTGYPNTTYSLYMARKGIAVGGFASTSDMTMKDRIEDLHLNFNDVASMPVFKFRWKDSEAHGNNINVGTSAQYWVSKEPLLVDGTEGSYSIQYGVLALACVKTTAEKVKELEDKVLELQEEIKTLKAV